MGIGSQTYCAGLEEAMGGFRRGFWIGLGVVCLAFVVAGARPARALGPSVDVFLGYSRLGSDAFYPNVGGLNGWNGAMHVKIRRFLGLEGDVSQYGFGAASSVPRTTSVMGGPRVTVGAMGVHIFAHALAGGEHSANSAGAAISGGALDVGVGGGVDVRIAPFFAWRVAGDYLTAPTQSPGTASHSRFSTGVVFRF